MASLVDQAKSHRHLDLHIPTMHGFFRPAVNRNHTSIVYLFTLSSERETTSLYHSHIYSSELQVDASIDFRFRQISATECYTVPVRIKLLTPIT